MRKPIIAGNWKMNVLPSQGVELVDSIWEGISGRDDVEVVICPPFVDLPTVSEAISARKMSIGLGAQNMHWERAGAYTGEVSPLMLKDTGVRYVIIGHSERRQFFGENDQGVNRKLKSALEHGLVPIVCVGESLKQREAGETENTVANQVKRAFFEAGRSKAGQAVIAYEPIWAIGTGVAATAEDANEVAGLIRDTLADIYDTEFAESLRIQYGGSVNPANISELMSMPNIDGALVGGVSLKPEDFVAIVCYS